MKSDAEQRKWTYLNNYQFIVAHKVISDIVDGFFRIAKLWKSKERQEKIVKFEFLWFAKRKKKSKSDVDKRWIVLKQTQARIARLSAYFIEISKKN